MKTSIKKIADYWINNNTISELQLNFDWIDCYNHCWNCGDNKSSKQSKKVRLERCHIIPNTLGGIDTASNYVLLCNDCHSQSPNINNKYDMWDWIKSNKMSISFYGTYRIQKALNMYKEKEGHDFIDKAVYINNLDESLTNELKNINTHGSKFNISTYYYMLKSIIKKHNL